MSAAPRKGRNRLSLILQLGSPKGPENSSVHPGTVSQDVPSALNSPVSFSSNSRTLPASVTRSPTTGNLPSPPPSSFTAQSTNNLAAQEKTRLLKKARKLSQILGEMPITELNEDAYNSQPEDNSSWSRKATRRISRNASLGLLPRRGLKTPPKVSPSTLRPPLVHNGPALTGHLAIASTQPGLPAGDTYFQVVNSPPDIPGAPPLDALVSPRRSSTDSRPGRATSRPSAQGPTFASPVVPSTSQTLPDEFKSRNTRSSSLPRNRARRSLDALAPSTSGNLKNASPSRPSTAGAGRPAPSATREHSLRRSKSMWAKKDRQLGDLPSDEPELRDRDAIIKDLKENSHFGESHRLTHAQRAQSIKRARKLNQVFGSEPPQALYQIPTVMEHSNRDSIATLLSIASADRLSIAVQTSLAEKHRSLSSLGRSSISSEPSSPVVTHPPPAESSRGHRHMPSTPPPFQDAAYFHDALGDGHASRSSLSSGTEDSAAFRQKRMRAAKLSRFFGVDIHDLAPSMDIPPPLPRIQHTASRVSAVQSVDVRIQESSKFWSRNDDREPDMHDVISRLREMR